MNLRSIFVVLKSRLVWLFGAVCKKDVLVVFMHLIFILHLYFSKRNWRVALNIFCFSFISKFISICVEWQICLRQQLWNFFFLYFILLQTSLVYFSILSLSFSIVVILPKFISNHLTKLACVISDQLLLLP